jgi:hypothetical protein
VSRPSSNSTFPPSVQVVRAESTYEGYLEAFRSVKADAVVSLVGSGALASQKAMIDAAVDAGVTRFVPSEFGANTEDSRVVELIPTTYKTRREIHEQLKQKAAENKDFSWTAVVCGPFFDWVQLHRMSSLRNCC